MQTGSRDADSPTLRLGGSLADDAALAATCVGAIESVAALLPAKPDRSPAQHELADTCRRSARGARREFLRLHVDRLYAELTDNFNTYVRLEDLIYAAADAYPWLVPSQKDIADERDHPQAEKEGRELDQALFVAAVLESPVPARHLIHAMLRPVPRAVDLLPAFRRTGVADLGVAAIERRDGIAYVEVRNDQYLNAEDDAVIEALETAVDLALLDGDCAVGVLRGGQVSHPRYRGRRVFSAGINLTDLYYGRISYIDFLMRRELGVLHKMLRGHWLGEAEPGGEERTREIPWIGAVETFAIGGGLQFLLVMDCIIAEQDAYFSLPALREGIVPGTGNLRLPRFVGDRLARQLIFADRRIGVATPEGRLICDNVVPAVEMDAEIAKWAARLAGPAVIANRRMLRVVQEPIDAFREYLANYARDQARLLYGPDLIRNLERGWLDRPRSG